MKIKQVEELVGITRKNIRFYEEQGLLNVERAENGYREYLSLIHISQETYLLRLKYQNINFPVTFLLSVT